MTTMEQPKAGRSQQALEATLAPAGETPRNRMTFSELMAFSHTPFFIPMLWKLFRAGWRVEGNALVHD